MLVYTESTAINEYDICIFDKSDKIIIRPLRILSDLHPSIRQNISDPDVIRTRSLLIWSQTRYRCATESLCKEGKYFLRDKREGSTEI